MALLSSPIMLLERVSPLSTTQDASVYGDSTKSGAPEVQFRADGSGPEKDLMAQTNVPLSLGQNRPEDASKEGLGFTSSDYSPVGGHRYFLEYTGSSSYSASGNETQFDLVSILISL
ncbi:hypothetical protein Salat_1425500 [Sesamum alatum]|uniref:Uncharacterized protein n=1 Tax=Sesamum alatum TaxID=300844 RepID=A0AAE1YAQ3_9LAMI|nr:hypothetical protein Salat_1425500 [Sesamum alatum]